jgi:hypothetical protein
MRFLIATLLATFLSASAAKEANIAFGIYQSCVKGTLYSVRDIEPTRVGISEFVNELDDYCLSWAVIWYPAFAGREVQKMTMDEQQKFNHLRTGLLLQLAAQLRLEALR